ncbi:MAG: translocation/assembly module TamB domain-containing protein [Comamonadaceae bacterium]
MRALRITLGAIGTALLAMLALAGMLWLWSGTSTSLATSLEQLARYLPADQTLEVKDVKGSLQGGGSIGWLRWQRGQLSVEAHNVSVAWTLTALLDRELCLGRLTIRQLRVDDQRPVSTPAVPTDLRLPLRVDAPFQVDTLEWAGPTSLQLKGLTGHYAFDGNEHRFDVSKVQMAAGSYRGSGRLQALSPMALTLQVQGSVATTLPSGGQRVTVLADASLMGNLAGLDAVLELQARLTPELPAALGKAQRTRQAIKTMQASVTARIQPWQAQAVARASAHWQSLDLATLWPQAPQTLLDGDATVIPAGPAWHAGVQLSNALSGPWDKQRLPINKLDATLMFAAGQWTVESLQASGAGGRMEALGKVSGTAQWQGSANLHGINPAALDSRLAATALDGQLTAQHTASGIVFDADLHVANRKSALIGTDRLDGLRLKAGHAQGIWHAPLLTLDKLALQTDDAQLQGQLTFNTVTQAAQGQLALNLTGGNASLKGHIASTSGQGEIRVNVDDAALASSWLARWPGMTAALGRTTMQGAVELTGGWQGGWQKQGQELQVQASVRAPKLELRQANQAADTSWRLRDWQADVSGTLRALSLSVRGQADNATRHFALQIQAHGGRINDGVWQGQLDAAQLSAQDSLRPGLWTMQSSDRVTLDWKQSSIAQSLNISAGSVRLTGPVAGAAAINWQAAQWSQRSGGNQASTTWRTQGSVQGLPLAWLDLLGQTQMANLGLRGDLLFGGQWDASGGDQLHLRAMLERSSGDLQLQTDAAGSVGKTSTLRAGVSTARLVLNADGGQLAASLRWDSESAGQVQADFATALQRQDGGWTWPTDAPLTGTLRAQLPSSGAWSLLAPPGWRLRGTLDANATVSGTRGAAQWRGTLQAQDLTVRSVADGIDFSQGTLRASLTGQRLDIESFTLQGAGGNSGGLVSVTGSVLWLPATAAPATLAARLRMTLDAEAKSWRVSTRADQRLRVSGKLTAQLDNARLAVRGTLKADEALFILPEDTAPQLSDDVRMRAPADSQARSAAAAMPATTGVDRRVTPDVAITLDLGQNFEVRGRGLLTHLAGTLELRSTPQHALAPQLSGQLRTVQGTYKAYGQWLDIEDGVLRFSGPYDNPALDILAIRPNLQQRVGVQISGTALSPVVRLYAEPDLPDADKLAWLVLGRSAANGGAEAAMLQQAALALLGGRGKSLSGSLAQSLGLDELSVRGVATSNADGTTSAAVTLGKRVSRNFYVAYERSLVGTLGTFYIFYDLSRRFTLRAQTGEQSAIDLIFTLRYD